MVGRLTFQEAGDEIDCRKMGVGGKAIPPHIEKVTAIQSDADFILLVRLGVRLTHDTGKGLGSGYGVARGGGGGGHGREPLHSLRGRMLVAM